MIVKISYQNYSRLEELEAYLSPLLADGWEIVTLQDIVNANTYHTFSYFIVLTKQT